MPKISSHIIPLLSTVLLTAFAHAQQPEVVVQTGLRDGRGAFAYDLQGHYFITLESARVKLWDTRTLMELWSYPREEGIPKFIRGGNHLLVVPQDRKKNSIHIVKAATGEVELEIPWNQEACRYLTTSGNRRFAFIYKDPSTYRRQLVVYDAESCQEEKRIDAPQGLEFNDAKSMIMGPDDQLLVMALGTADGRRMIAFDLDAGDSLWTARVLGEGGALRISPDGKWLTSANREENEIHLYNTATGRLTETISFEHAFGYRSALTFCGPDELLYTRKSRLYAWDLSRLETDPLPPARQIEHPQVDFTWLIASPDGKQLIATGDKSSGNKMQVLERESLAILKTVLFAERSYGRMKVDESEARIYFAQKWQSLRFWDLTRGKVVVWPDSKNRFLPWDTPAGRLYFNLNASATSPAALYDPVTGRKHVFENSHYIPLVHPDGRRMVTNNDPFKTEEKSVGVVLWDLQRRQQLHELILGNKLNCRFAFTPDGKKLAAGDFDIHVLKVGKKELKPWKRLPHPGGVTGRVYDVRFTGKDRLQAIYMNKSVVEWDVKKETPLVTRQLELGNSFKHVVYSPDERMLALQSQFLAHLLDWPSGQPRFVAGGHADELRDLAFGDDGRRFYTTDRFGMTRIWDIPTGEPIASLVAFPPDGYLIVLPDNQYLASPGVVKKVGFRYDGRVYPFEQFDLKLNRPDRVLEKLGHAKPSLIAAYRKAYEKRLRKMNFTEEILGDDFHLPEVELKTADIPSSTSERILHFDVLATDDRHPLDRLNLYVNDVPVHGIAGIDLRALNTRTHERTFELALSTGANKVQISVLNQQGVESLKETFRVTCTAPAVRPDLYVAAIGISDYADDDFDLNYAAKDAGDLSALLQGSTEIYGTVHIRKILDHDATRENILALRDFLMQSKVDDQVVLFLAGHGLLDDSLDYYFATADIDFYDPADRGLAYEELEGLVDGIPARRKLVLIDACHSGEVDEEETELVAATTVEDGTVKSRGFKRKKAAQKKPALGLASSFELMRDLFADLRRGSGAMVISSASGAEYAFESPQWRNGVFTYSLLEGLQSNKADADNSGDVRVSELRDYVIARVRDLTQGEQTPTARRENLEYDFRVY